MSTGIPHQPANRLATSSSPYLLQHKHNPVDWYPWGDEAIAAARQRGVPIFLSIGYSTCYWCHVMERECFENKAIAEQMNAGFVCIKLDREERPDLDDLYMAATQMLTGHGGWPMSVFLDPASLKPFWAGTYFPPAPARGMPSLPQVLQRMSDAWNIQRQSTLSQAQTVAAAVAERLAARSAPVVVGPEQVGMAVQTLLAIFDRTHGGFGNAPKFPQPVYLELMLSARARLTDQSHRTAVDAALTRTLDAMALGGIFDHVGGGFHRYSVDASWTVPHFEKMLYDNAQLLGVYAQAAADFNDPFYAHVAERIVEYVQREMTGPAGMFYTAQDAEVDGREGLSYLWTQEQFDTALPREDAAFAKAIYGLDAGKNFQDPHHPDTPAANVLRLSQRPDQAELQRLKRINALLLYTRNHRKQPRLDDKIIRSWNGLMVAALARAGRLLGRGEWIDAANRVIEPGFASLFTAHGRFDSRVARQSGQAVTHTGSLLLEDLAAEAVALCELQRAQSGSSRANAEAAVLAVSIARELFADNEGAFHDTAAASDLFVRPRTTYDGAIPTGSSMMLHALIDLYELTGDTAHLKSAIDMLRSLSAAIHDSPIAAVNSTRGLLRLLSSQPEAVQHAMADLSPAGVRAVAGENAPVVEVFASTAQVQVGPESPAEFFVKIVVPDGWHINDAFAGEASNGTIPPLVIGIAHGTGVQPYAEFPRGTPIQGSAHGVLVGEVVFPVVLERVGEWSGHPRLLLTYQACSDRACLEPATVELSVEIKPIDND